jgi:hypothetical protein
VPATCKVVEVIVFSDVVLILSLISRLLFMFSCLFVVCLFVCLFVCLDADNANGQKLSFLCLLLMNNGSLHYFLCHLYWLITVTFVLQCRAFFCTFIFPLTLYTNLQTSSNSLRLPRGWCIKFATVLNTKIEIVQKVYKWSRCPFVKMILKHNVPD